MKPKMIEAGRPITVGDLSLTILLELAAGRDKRAYKVKDQHGALYIYKYCKRRHVKREVRRAEILARHALPHAKVIASGSDFVLREWVNGSRGDDWLKSWESFGAPIEIDALEDLIGLLDRSARAGVYVGNLEPESLMLDHGHWKILDSGSIMERSPRVAATRYFWKMFERWGMKLDRQRNSLLRLLNALLPLGVNYPPDPFPAVRTRTERIERTERTETEPAPPSSNDAVSSEEDMDSDDDDDDSPSSGDMTSTPSSIPSPFIEPTIANTLDDSMPTDLFDPPVPTDLKNGN